MTKLLFFSYLFIFSFLFLFSQENEVNSILSIKSTTSFNSNQFNKTLKKELSSSILFVYNFKDLESDNLKIRLSYFKKPISKYAFENFREMELYKNILPKPLDLINFQRNMNKL